MKEKTAAILKLLSEQFPNPKSELNYNNVFELLTAVILSAQCTDKRVNEITKTLFQVADTPEKMRELSIDRLEELIHSAGFYKNKAKFLHNMSADLVDRFDGKVPNDIDSLRSLDGVGQKTANVVYAVGFNGQALAVDTHVFRVARRLGLADAKTPEKVEEQLKNEIDENMWTDSHHYLLLHGRYVCKARNPECEKCVIKDYCDYYQKSLISK